MIPLRRTLLLLPGHGLEDLPEELDEQAAESLMSAAAVAWHPVLIAMSDDAPKTDRADDPPPVHAGTAVLTPSNCVDLVPPEWIETAEQRAAIRLTGHVAREQWCEAITAIPQERHCPVGDETERVPASEAAIAMRDHFFSLGTSVMHLTRLARRLHIFEDIELERVFAAAAEAAIAETEDEVRIALNRGFEALLEFRERLYPVDAGLLDIVLVEADAGPEVAARIAGASRQTPVSLLGSVEQFEAIADAIREPIAAAGDAVDIILGEPADYETMLAPLHQTAATLAETRRRTFDAIGLKARCWGRRELALRAQLPTVLKGAGFAGALHIGFDLGEYPDDEEARLDWVGLDHTPINAVSRMPLPSARAASMWGFPPRLGESMELDYAAVALLVGFAEPPSVWLQDLRIASTYGPVFGPMLTIGEFFSGNGSGARQLREKASSYRSAALPQRVARDEPDALSRERVRWADSIAASESSIGCGLAELATGSRPSSEPVATLARVIAPGDPTGMLVLNTAPFERTGLIETPQPVATGSLSGCQQRSGDGYTSLVTVPPLGYAFVPFARSVGPASKTPLVEELTLRNDFFELTVSEATGGIASVRSYETRGNLLSQQIAYLGEGEDEPDTRMVADRVSVVEDGATQATIESRGSLIDRETGQTRGSFIQSVTIARGNRRFAITIEVEPAAAIAGGPWTNYFACRWAWAAASVPVAQSVDWDAVPAAHSRLESPLFIEIGESPRLTILPCGQTFHRRTGNRILETLLAVRGSTENAWSGSVAVGSVHPGESAWASMTLLAAVPSAAPRIESAWLARVSQPGVLVLGIDPSPNPRQPGLVVLLRETEGRRGTCQLALCRPIKDAITLDWMDAVQSTLPVIDGAVEVALRGHDIKRVFVSFA